MLRGLGDIGKMGALLKQAMEMKSKMEEVKKELEKMELTASVGSGMVTVTVNGAMEVLSLQIAPEIFEEGREMVETMVQAAVNKAIQEVQDRVRAKMSELTGGLEIPEGF